MSDTAVKQLKPLSPSAKFVLHLLREAGPDRGVTTNEFLLAGAGSRFGGRILELREHGHVIETSQFKQHHFIYKLTRDAGDDVERGSRTPDSDRSMSGRADASAGVSHGAAPPVSPERPAADSPPDLLSSPESGVSTPPAVPDRLFDPPADSRPHYADEDAA